MVDYKPMPRYLTEPNSAPETPPAPASKDRSLGPAPLPTFHGKGCICKQYPRKDCPALQTPEGQERERARELNSARCRLREAEIRWSEAGGEVARLRAVLKRMSTGDVPATDFVQLSKDALVGSPDETSSELEQLRRIDCAARRFVDFLDTCAPQGGVWTDYVPTDLLDALQPLELALFDGRASEKAPETFERCHFRAFGQFACELPKDHAGDHTCRLPEGPPPQPQRKEPKP